MLNLFKIESKNIWNCSKTGDFESVQKYVEKDKAVVNKPDPNGGYTPLQFASAYGHLKLVKYLVLNGAELNTKDEDGDTPLHDAAYMGKLDVVKYLVENTAADLSLTNKKSFRPYDRAITSGVQPVIDYIYNTKYETERRFRSR